jgi:hypothetical protein
LRIKASVLLVLVLLVPLPSVFGNAQETSAHPRLFFTSADLGELREKREALSGIWEIIYSNAGEYLSELSLVVSGLDAAEYGALYHA